MLDLVLAALLTPRTELVFGTVESVHSRMDSGTVRANFESKDHRGTTKRAYTLRFRWPDEARLTETDSGGATVRERAVAPRKSTDYDATLEQYVVQDRAPSATLGGALASLVQDLDDLLLTYTDPKAFGVWFAPMRALTGWTFSKKGKLIESTYKDAKRSMILSIEVPSGRLVRVSMSEPASSLVWNMTYSNSVDGLAFRPPRSASRVPRFDPSMTPPKFASDDARALAQKMFTAYEGLSSIGYVVKRPEGKTNVLLSGQFARQQDDRSKWTYDGRTLVMNDAKSGKWYRGDMTFTEVIETTARLGTRVDPSLRSLMTGFNPFRKRMDKSATLRVVGAMRINGADVKMLTAESDLTVITLTVRTADGLVISTQSRANDPGEIGTEVVEVGYEYFPVPNDATKKYALAIPKGAKVEPFPKKS